jgi:hypothetical protein
MNYKTFRSHLGRAGLTNKDFAELVGLNSKSITNYAKNDVVPVHWAIVAMLMGELVGNELEFQNLLRKMVIKPNKVRGAAAKGRWGGSKESNLPILGEDNG